MKQFWKWMGRNLVPLLAASWFIFLATWIVLRGSDLSGITDVDQATLASSERLVQMAQWTVTTVLTLGGALIGLNWYQNERRYYDDKAALERKVNDSIHELSQRLSFLEFVSNAQLQMSVFQAVSNKTGDPENPSFVFNCIEGYRSASEKPMRSAYASVMRQYAIAASQNRSGHYTRQGTAQLQEFTSELRREFPEVANEIAVLLAMADSTDRGD